MGPNTTAATPQTPLTQDIGPYYSKPHSFDPNFRGPLQNRSCTDIIFLLVFVFFLVGWVIIGVIAFRHGNPEKLIYPSDSNGRLCGVGNMTYRPRLFFFDLSKCRPEFLEGEIIPTFGCFTPQVCVANCPNETFSAVRYVKETLTPEKEKEIKSKMICVDGTNMNLPLKDLIADKKCAPYYLKSSPISGRCIPDINRDKDLIDTIAGNGSGVVVSTNGTEINLETLKKHLKRVQKFLETRAWAQLFVEDVFACWPYIIGGLVIAMVVALIYIVLIRFFAGIMIWFSIIAMIVVFSWASFACFKRYVDLKGVPGSDAPFKLSRRLESYTSKRKTWLILGIICSVILAILLLTLLFLRKRIRIAIALIKEGAKVIGRMPSALFLPIVPYILEILIICIFLFNALMLASSQMEQNRHIVMNATTDAESRALFMSQDKFDNISRDIEVLVTEEHVSYAQIYNFFAFLWVMAFISAIGQMALAGAVASYYWAFRKPQDIPFFTVLSGLWLTVRYHLGSAAFGSLIIAIVRFIRAILTYIQKKLQKYDNDVVKCMMKCCQCCFWMLEKFLKFINKNAYIMIAIYGKNFCWSAREAFMLLLRNVMRVVVLDKVTDFLIFVAKIVVVGGCGLFAHYFFTRQITALNDFVPDLNYQHTPVIMITIGSYLIASCFFHVYDMAVDTLFLCFLEDCERNDGSKERPYYMSKELMKILNKKNYQEPEQELPSIGTSSPQ